MLKIFLSIIYLLTLCKKGGSKKILEEFIKPLKTDDIVGIYAVVAIGCLVGIIILSGLLKLLHIFIKKHFKKDIRFLDMYSNMQVLQSIIMTCVLTPNQSFSSNDDHEEIDENNEACIICEKKARLMTPLKELNPDLINFIMSRTDDSNVVEGNLFICQRDLKECELQMSLNYEVHSSKTEVKPHDNVCTYCNKSLLIEGEQSSSMLDETTRTIYNFDTPLPFSLYLLHGFCSESEQPEGNRVKQFHLFDLIILASLSELCFNRHYTTQNPVGVSLFTYSLRRRKSPPKPCVRILIEQIIVEMVLVHIYLAHDNVFT